MKEIVFRQCLLDAVVCSWLGGVCSAPTPGAAATTQTKPSFEIYGFAMLDIGHDFKQIDPNWSDTMRVTKLPSVRRRVRPDHSTFAGVRQSRLGVRASTPTSLGELKTTFEFELFGTGVDEGQTTFRLRHAYGELGAFGAGQTWSPFMDPDVFPNSLEYWGPTGMVFFRNVQVRWMPFEGRDAASCSRSSVLAPAATRASTPIASSCRTSSLVSRCPISPELQVHGRTGATSEPRGMLRVIKWDDVLDDQFDLSGDATGWGLNLSSNLKAGASDTIRLQVVFGEGIQNYMNDAPVDIGIVNNFQNPVTPIIGEALPIIGFVAFLDHNWNEKFTSTRRLLAHRHRQHRGSGGECVQDRTVRARNLLYTPVPNVMVGGELQWGRRENFSDGFT